MDDRNKALRWAVSHGILSADEPTAVVTKEELANALYRGADYFFGEIVAFLQKDAAAGMEKSGAVDSTHTK